MKQKKAIFLSGPMTGYQDYNFKHFNEVAAKLEKCGLKVVNPVDICKKYKQEEVVKHKEVFDAMIAEQQKREREDCSAILLLDGWKLSLGVRLELKTALELDFDIYTEEDIPDLCGVEEEKSAPDSSVTRLHYESLRDKALDMAWTLRKIDQELHAAAQCEGDYPGGYPSKKLLPELCKIMYASQGYHDQIK